MKVKNKNEILQHLHNLVVEQVREEATQGQLGMKHGGGDPGPTGQVGPPGVRGMPGAAYVHVEDTPRNKVPTKEEIDTIAARLDVGRGFTVPLQERSYVIKYNGVKICARGARTNFKTIGGAKVSLATSRSLRHAFFDYLKDMRGMAPDEGFTYRGCKAALPDLVDALIKSGKITIELE